MCVCVCARARVSGMWMGEREVMRFNEKEREAIILCLCVCERVCVTQRERESRYPSLKGKTQYSLVSLPICTRWFQYSKHYLLFHKISYLNEEVNCAEAYTSNSVPWLGYEREIMIYSEKE
jgi:hypothetical protein